MYNKFYKQITIHSSDNLVSEWREKLWLVILSAHNMGGAWWHWETLKGWKRLLLGLGLLADLVVVLHAVEEILSACRWLDVLDADVDLLWKDLSPKIKVSAYGKFQITFSYGEYNSTYAPIRSIRKSYTLPQSMIN